MLFNSFEFLILFLPAVLAISIRLRGRGLIVWVTLASFVFYAFAGHVWFLLPMLVTTCLDFQIGKLIHAAKSKKSRDRWLVFSLTCNLGLLAWFKYAGLFWKTFAPAAAGPGADWLQVALPAGISFYTFQTISYVVDVWRKYCPAAKSFWRFAGFVSFFPHLVAGPLTRHHQLIPQLARIEQKGIRPEWIEGLALLAIGLIKKVVIGDRLALMVDPLLNDPSSLGIVDAWLALMGYTFQIYFDFSGYSDMALGIGLFFGVRLPLNFKSPYTAVSPSDFWRRWHMTLSQWLRDYLYIPLGGSRCSPVRAQINLVITMVLGGLWHGASWTFAAWGLYHGTLLALTRGGGLEKRPVFGRLATFLAVSLGWVFFRSADFSVALKWFAALAGVSSARSPYMSTNAVSGQLALAVIACFAITQFFRNSSELAPELFDRSWKQAVVGAGLVAVLLLVNQSSRFLYFQF